CIADRERRSPCKFGSLQFSSREEADGFAVQGPEGGRDIGSRNQQTRRCAVERLDPQPELPTARRDECSGPAIRRQSDSAGAHAENETPSLRRIDRKAEHSFLGWRLTEARHG